MLYVADHGYRMKSYRLHYNKEIQVQVCAFKVFSTMYMHFAITILFNDVQYNVGISHQHSVNVAMYNNLLHM